MKSSLLKLIMIALVFCATSCLRPDSPTELKIMSFNIRYGTAEDGENHWQHRKRLLFDVIAAYHPDILSVQEALRFQLNEIDSAALRPDYLEVGVARDDGKTAGEFASIFFRTDRFELLAHDTFWFSDTPEKPSISPTWGNWLKRICTWAVLRDRETSRAFTVYNLHLDHASQTARRNSVLLLSRVIANRPNRDPVILTGDFNAGEQNEIIAYLKGEASLNGHTSPVTFIDSYRALHPDDQNAGTFNAWSGDTTGDKIDYIFVAVSSSVQVIEADIVRTHVNGRYPSDHFPVTARLRLLPDRR